MLNESPGIGIDYRTGQLIDGWQHVVQSLEILFSTRYGERVMREYVGSLIPALLGQNLTARTVNRTKMAMWVAIETFEPRYRITQITSLDVSRTGHYGLELSGVYRPRAHLGDFTADGSRKLRVGATADRAVTFEPL